MGETHFNRILIVFAVLHFNKSCAKIIAMKTNTLLVASVFSILFAGCWTISETEYPNVEVARLPKGKTVSVAFDGFAADVRKYMPVEGHEQMVTNAADRIDGPCVKDNNSTNMYYMSRNTVARKLIDRASVGMERKGFDIKVHHPQYVVKMDFDGPVERDCDVLKQIGLGVCTLLTAEKEAETWTGHLQVFDYSNKKQVFERYYTNDYSVTVWGPIPVASPACHERITPSACNSWVLTAMTDEAIADASKFLGGQTK